MTNDKLQLFLDIIGNPMFISNKNGEIIYKNADFNGLELKLEILDFKNILQFDETFDMDNIKTKKILTGRKEIKKLNLNYIIYYLEEKNYTEKVVYIFQKTLISNSMVEKVINNVDDIIVFLDKEGRLLNYNDKSRRTLYKTFDIDIKYEIGERVGKLNEEGIAGELIAPEVIRDKKYKMKNVYYKNNLSLMWSGNPLFDENGAVYEIVLTGRDVSEMVKLEKEIMDAEKLRIKYKKQIEELKKTAYENDDIIYSSKEMETVVNIAKRVAKTDAAVFLNGPSGVGKEKIAKLIHANSERSNKPFVAINCAAIPKDLFESEFFGYEEGAFTGAKKGGKMGFLEEANHGTVFLDELGEMPMEMQSKLLRVIQENQVQRVGSNKTKNIDVRYISATNISIQKMMDQTRFRQDLYYRLAVIQIDIPPISRRREDILPLIEYFLEGFNNKYKRNTILSQETLLDMYNYKWRGNVRQIRNIVERLVILSDKDVIGVDEFKLAISFDKASDEESIIDSTANTGKNMISEKMSKNENNKQESETDNLFLDNIVTMEQAYNEVENLLINRAVKANGSIRKAAKELEINPSTIYRKIKNGTLHIENY